MVDWEKNANTCLRNTNQVLLAISEIFSGFPDVQVAVISVFEIIL